MRVFADKVGEFVGESVELYGWIRSKRLHGKIAFLDLRDYTGVVQVVLKGDLIEKVRGLNEESVIKVKGKVVERKVKNPAMKTGDYEIIAEDIEILSRSDPIPINIYDPNTSLSKRLDFRFLDLRNRRNFLIFKLKSEISNLVREFFHENGFIEIHPTAIISEASEGGAEVFPVVYFDKEGYLIQSVQLHKQYLMAAGFEKVFSIMPAWRAEPHFTTRHLCEFWSVDAEISFIKDHFDVMKVLENLVKFVVENLEGREVVKDLDLELPNTEFKYISLKELKKIIKREGGPYEDILDLSTEEEAWVGDYFWDKGMDFVLVYEYGWEKRPFYHMRKEGESEVTKSFDLIYDGLEITTGAQREHRYEVLVEQAKEKGVKLEKISWYLESFKYGMPPHGGFGFGLDRFVKQLVGLKNIREAVLFPRDPERLWP